MLRFILTVLTLFTLVSGYGQSYAQLEALIETKLKQEDYQSAVILTDKALQLSDTSKHLYFLKAELLLHLNDVEGALWTLQDGLEKFPQEAEFYNSAGIIYSGMAEAEAAVHLYNQAMRLADSDSIRNNILVNRGSAWLDVRKFEAARKDLEQALTYDPTNLVALNNIGHVYSELGMTEESLSTLKKIISLDPDFYGGYINLGFIYSEIDSLDQAIYYFNKAMEIDAEEPYLYSNRGYAFYRQGKYKEALQDLNKSVQMLPTNAYVYRNLALVYLALENFSEACTALKAAQAFNYEVRYGNEVNELLDQHCQ